MRNKFLSLLPWMLLFTACAGLPAEKSGDFPGYRIFDAENTILLHPGQEESPRMTIRVSLLDADTSEELRNLLRHLLYDGVGPEEYLRTLTAHYENEYAEMRSLEASESMNWNYTEKILPETEASGGIVISRSRDYYLGGAHGMQEKAYFVISQKEAETLKLEDILLPGTKDELAPLIAEALRSYAKLQPGEPLSAGGFFENAVEIPGNFFLSPGGLGFHWDPYEIAPYVMGPIEVIIPSEQILPLLNSRGNSLGILE